VVHEDVHELEHGEKLHRTPSANSCSRVSGGLGSWQLGAIFASGGLYNTRFSHMILAVYPVFFACYTVNETQKQKVCIFNSAVGGLGTECSTDPMIYYVGANARRAPKT
jgi:hypothetical protein